MWIRICLIILLLASTAWSAEILVRITDNWMLSADTTGWSQKQLNERRRAKKSGSPIVVMPDNHVWGNSEKPPRYIIIALPGFSVDTLRKYLQPLMDGDSVVFRKRYTFPKSFIDSVMVKPGGRIVINKNKKQIQKWLDALIIRRDLE